MTRSVVFLLAAHHCGSHLLAQLLGAHSRCLSIGELGHRSGSSPLAARNIVSDYRTNPLFEGLAGAPEPAWHARIFANAAPYWPHVTTLIDNSKDVAWARRFTDVSEITAYYVHLLRDPRALLRRRREQEVSMGARLRARRRLWRRGRGAWLPALVRPIDAVRTLDWVMVNEEIDRFVEGRQASIVLYEELVEDPRACLTRLMPRLGLTFEESQLAYGRAAHAGTLKRDYIGASARSIIRADLRWQTELPAGIIRRVARIRRLGRYLSRLNLTLTDAGLRRIGATVHQAPVLQNASIRRDAGARS